MSHAAYVAYEPCSWKVLILISSRIVFFGVFPLAMFASVAAEAAMVYVCVEKPVKDVDIFAVSVTLLLNDTLRSVE